MPTDGLKTEPADLIFGDVVTSSIFYFIVTRKYNKSDVRVVQMRLNHIKRQKII